MKANILKRRPKFSHSMHEITRARSYEHEKHIPQTLVEQIVSKKSSDYMKKSQTSQDNFEIPHRMHRWLSREWLEECLTCPTETGQYPTIKGLGNPCIFGFKLWRHFGYIKFHGGGTPWVHLWKEGGFTSFKNERGWSFRRLGGLGVDIFPKIRLSGAKAQVAFRCISTITKALR